MSTLNSANFSVMRSTLKTHSKKEPDFVQKNLQVDLHKLPLSRNEDWRFGNWDKILQRRLAVNLEKNNQSTNLSNDFSTTEDAICKDKDFIFKIVNSLPKDKIKVAVFINDRHASNLSACVQKCLLPINKTDVNNFVFSNKEIDSAIYNEFFNSSIDINRQNNLNPFLHLGFASAKTYLDIKFANEEIIGNDHNTIALVFVLCSKIARQDIIYRLQLKRSLNLLKVYHEYIVSQESDNDTKFNSIFSLNNLDLQGCVNLVQIQNLRNKQLICNYFNVYKKAKINCYTKNSGEVNLKCFNNINLFTADIAFNFSNACNLYQEAKLEVYNWLNNFAPRINSQQINRNILNDNSNIVLRGLIGVASEAQLTDAYFSNANLINNDNAKATIMPQLEIYADDVKCSHGSTTSKLDKSAVYYLMSRGISKESAIDILEKGFIDYATKVLSDDNLINWLTS